MPPVRGRIDSAFAEVVDSDRRSREIIEVGIDLSGGRIEGNVHRLIVEDILRYDRSGDRRLAEEVDSGWTRGRSISEISRIVGEVVAHNDVVIEVDRW